MATAEFTDIGPIHNVTMPIPEDGGVVVFRGRNGTGKSTGLACAEAAMGAKHKLRPRDRTASGKVEFGGITLSVGQSIRRKGELEVVALESQYTIADLVDPGIIDQATADNHRIKSLVKLTGAEADPSLFYDLAGGQAEFEAICAAKPEDDLVTLAARFKRSAEAEARKVEEQAGTEDGHAQACKEVAKGVDLEAPSDSAELQSRHEQAVKHHQRLVSLAEESQRASASIQEAREKLEAAEQEYDGPTVEDAKAQQQAAHDDERDAFAKVEAARAALQAAEKEHEQARNKLALKVSVTKAAEQHASLVAAWREQLAADAAAAPSDIELADAEAMVVSTREAIEAGVLVRRAKESLTKARTHQENADKLRRKGHEWRDAARGIDEVLSSVVAQLGSELRVKDGRLVTDTEARGETLFGELSEGERWKLAARTAIQAVGRGGMLTLPQTAWEGLDPINRRVIYEEAKGSGVVIATAEADGGDLRAEEYVPANGEAAE